MEIFRNKKKSGKFGKTLEIFNKLIKRNLNWEKVKLPILFVTKISREKKKKLENLAKHWQILNTLVEFTMGKKKNSPFFCQKNCQENKNIQKFGKTLENFRKISGIYTYKQKFPHFFFVTKISRKEKTLKILAKHWKILEKLVEFTLEKKNPHIFFVSKLVGEKIKLIN